MKFNTPRSIVVFATLLGLGACGPDAQDSGSNGGKGGSAGGQAGTGGTSSLAGSTAGSTAAGNGGSAGLAGSGGVAGAGGMGTAGSSDPGTALPLPLVVSTHFNNQGWFGDAAVAASFTAGSMTIKQSESSSGPCGMRSETAKGKCFQVVYTPPAGLKPPAEGGFVGIFFLTTLTKAHADTMTKAGGANWGDEPGKNIAPGATKISFLAAAAQAGTRVTFKAGTDKDAFLVPEQEEPLTTSWAPYSLSLAGQSYGSSVIGAFAWVIKDTTKPATFYLDGIVWE